MIICDKGLQVGTLQPDASITTQNPRLSSLQDLWKKEGFIQFTSFGTKDENKDPIEDKGGIIYPSAENLDVVVTNLRNEGYEVE